jgi:hypothetical protein
MWSRKFAYGVGLLVADGCLSKDGRHIDFTSKDKAQVDLFKKCLRLQVKSCIKYSGSGTQAYCVQFGDVLFYRFLVGIGLTSAKSKTLSSIRIPQKYFFDFVRGYFDGDGCSYSYWDSQYKLSFRFYISFASASPLFIAWLRGKLSEELKIKGYVNGYPDRPYLQLKYAKKEAVVLSKKMYYRAGALCLQRKYVKIKSAVDLIT